MTEQGGDRRVEMVVRGKGMRLGVGAYNGKVSQQLSAVRTFSDVLQQSLVVRAVVSCQNSVVWQLSAVRTV